MLIVSLILGITLCGIAQTEPENQVLNLKSQQVVPVSNRDIFLKEFDVARETVFAEQFFRIIHFSAIPSVEDKEVLKQAGVYLLDYLPVGGYFASIRTDFDREALRMPTIRSIIPVEAGYKLDPALVANNFPAHAVLEDGSVKLTLSYYPNLDPMAVTSELIKAGVRVLSREDFGRYMQIVVPVESIQSLANLPFVMFLEPAPAEPEPENSNGRTLHHTNVIASDYPGGRHFDGTGVHVMLQDDGIIGPHADYKGRIGDQFLTSNNGDHGDHCAGIIMGAGNIDPKAKGNAFGSTLFVYSVSPGYPGFTAIPTVYNTLSIRVTSASYGDGCNAGYTSLTRTLDQQVRQFPSLMHVFSAGNSGADNCGYGAGNGWGNITGGHKQGKNVIAVANLDLQDNLSSSSSRGPAHDGRIKPDIGAKGSSVYSTIDPNNYGLKSGTSMACPGIAGTLAQLIQAYRELNNGSDPMAGLLKAAILNTAEDLGNPGPDFKFGWGRVNALRAVGIMEEGRYDSGVVTQGASLTHQIVVPANTAQLRVMVYWTDYEASVNTNLALVNNLDIVLSDPASVNWLPWRLSHYPHPDSLNMPAVRGVDNRNNMEQVTIDDPGAGIYTLHIQGTAIPQGPQTYYVVYEFIHSEVVLTYPIGGESFVPGETELIRWDAAGNSAAFMLLNSMDNGTNWDTIVQGLSGGTRSFNWTVPSGITGKALVKISDGVSASQSEAPFSIAGVPCNLQVDWACDDAVHLSWSPVPGAIGYDVYRLGEKFMDSVGTTQVTSMIVAISDPSESDWFSVRAFGANGATGRRAYAIEKEPGSFGCHSVDLMAESSPSAGWGVFNSAMNPDEVMVSLIVRNFGMETISNPEFSFQFDNEAVVTEVYSGSLMPDSSVFFTFQPTINLTGPGLHSIRLWIHHPQDQNLSNDSLSISLEVTEGEVIAVGMQETFDGWAKCLSVPACELYSCTLDTGWINLENGVYDDHDWRVFSGSTPSAGTGPDYDHTTGTSTGKYLYIEPSHTCLVKQTSMITPAIGLTGSLQPMLGFWYHAFGPDVGTLSVDIFDGNQVTQNALPSLSGDQGNSWKKYEADLSAWVGKIISIRFRAITGCEDKGDLAIDDFSVTEFVTGDKDPLTLSFEKLKIFPNPANQSVNIKLETAALATYLLHVLDISGRIVVSKDVTPVNGSINENLDIRHLNRGAYLVKLEAEGKVLNGRLMIR